ncbi:hypothetical protein ACFX1T_000236 [Malus domestica]
MAPKLRLACESGEGIVILHRCLNGLHRLRVGLDLLIFFLEDGAPSGTFQTSRVPIAIESNMPAKELCTFNPYEAEKGISAAKWLSFKRGFPSMTDATWLKWVDKIEPIWKKKWMENSIYELIMMSKITIPINHELLSATLLFWNNETNIFDFRMGVHDPKYLRHGSGI